MLERLGRAIDERRVLVLTALALGYVTFLCVGFVATAALGASIGAGIDWLVNESGLISH